MSHRQQIVTSINKYMDIARAEFPNVDLPNPTISFKMRGATALGQARMGPRTWMIRINDMIAQKYLDDAVNDTAPHEVAHLVAYKVHGRCQGHGANWKRIMHLFGVPANRCADSSIDTLEFKVFKAKTEYMYHCGNPSCEHSLGTARHRKIQFGSVYTCRKTGGRLTDATFIGSERKSAAQRKAEAFAKAGKALPGAKHKLPNPTKPIPTFQKAAKKPASPNRPTGVSKKDQAAALYRQHKGQSRKFFIALFIEKLGMKAAGASTYYYNCTKEFG